MESDAGRLWITESASESWPDKSLESQFQFQPSTIQNCGILQAHQLHLEQPEYMQWEGVCTKS